MLYYFFMFVLFVLPVAYIIHDINTSGLLTYRAFLKKSYKLMSGEKVGTTFIVIRDVDSDLYSYVYTAPTVADGSQITVIIKPFDDKYIHGNWPVLNTKPRVEIVACYLLRGSSRVFLPFVIQEYNKTQKVEPFLPYLFK